MTRTDIVRTPAPDQFIQRWRGKTRWLQMLRAEEIRNCEPTAETHRGMSCARRLASRRLAERESMQ